MRTDGVGDFKWMIHSVLPPDGVHGEGPVALGPLHPLTEPQTHVPERSLGGDPTCVAGHDRDVFMV